MLAEQLAMKVEQSPTGYSGAPKKRRFARAAARMCHEGQQKAQPASSELEVNAVSASKIRMQTKSPAQEEHVRPRVTFEPLALKDEQSHKAVPQYKRSRELPPRPAPFIRRARHPSRLCKLCPQRCEPHAVKRHCIGSLRGGLRRHV